VLPIAVRLALAFPFYIPDFMQLIAENPVIFRHRFEEKEMSQVIGR
jgi:hypothetical protein